MIVPQYNVEVTICKEVCFPGNNVASGSDKPYFL